MGVENPKAAYMGAEETKLCAITLTKPALVTNTLEKNTGAKGQYAGRRSLAPGQPLAPVFFQDIILRLRANVLDESTYPPDVFTLSIV